MTLADRSHQAAVTVGDHQTDPAQATFAQAAQELAPEHLGLAVTHLPHSRLRSSGGTPIAQHLTAAVLADAGGDDHGLGDDPVVHAHLAVGRVQVEVGEATVPPLVA